MLNHAFDALPLTARHFSGTEVLRFRDKAFQTYFTDPAYLLMMQEKFGPDTVAEIVKMAAYRLPRKYLDKP